MIFIRLQDLAMRYCEHSRIFYIGIMIIWVIALAGNFSYLRGADAGLKDVRTEERPVPEIDDRVPRIKSGHSYLKVLSIDLLVPGGGHFYLGHYYTGAAFAGLKLAGAFSLYYFYKDLEKKRDEYHSIQDDPYAGYDQIEGHRRDFERAHQHLAFAVIGTAAAYISSLIFNYSDIKIINERAIPTFDLRFSGTGGALHSGDRELFFVFNLRV